MKPPLTSPGPRYAALLQLLRTAESLWNASRVFFDRWKLSPSQFNVLNLLRDHPAGCSQSELGRQLIMHRSNVTGLVDRLEKRGLVCRAEDTADRRSWRVALAPGGERLLREILPRYYAEAEKIWGHTPPRRAQTLARELSQLAAHAAQLTVEKPD